MSQVLITGATGLVGGYLLRMLIQERKVNYIAAPTRRPLAAMPGVFNPHAPKLSDALAQVCDPIDIVFCCLGTTRREAGSKGVCPRRLRAGCGYALRAKKLGPNIWWWSVRWGQTQARRSFYNKVKGKMEDALIAQKWEQLTIVRPSMLLGHRDERRFNESILPRCFASCPVTGNLSRRGMSRVRC
jgi:uncharacterized protein YbjT (DUF2867 family)